MAGVLQNPLPLLVCVAWLCAASSCGVHATAGDLHCGLPFAYAPPATAAADAAGSHAATRVGVSGTIGGIGVSLELANLAFPDKLVNVLEPRSAAGAGWQTSYLVQDQAGGVGTMVFNQAAGNSIGTQWGYEGTYAGGGGAVAQGDWSPLFVDHIHETGFPFCPCDGGGGYTFDDGRLSLASAVVPCKELGAAVNWTNEYHFRSRMNQSWPSWSTEQAFYLSKTVASEGNLRIYLRSGNTTLGPINPVKRFSIPGGSCVQSAGSACNLPAQDYAVLVWNIFGLDVGVALPGLKNGVSLNMEELTYCADASNPACGNINFHSWVLRGGGDITAGSVRSVAQSYIVGTLPQLNALGFSI